MRFGALPALVVLGASLVAASPIRVVVTEVSYGHAAAEAHDVAHIPTPIFRPVELKPHRRPFCQSMKDKALDATNALRQMLGLETIKPDIRVMHHPHHVELQGGAATGPVIAFKDHKGALPVLPFVGTPVRPAFAPEGEEGSPGEHQGNRTMWVHRHPHRLRGSFLRRVHHALMSLGCGIGVLLRMVWVMVLVTARAFRGSRNEDAEYEVVFDEAELLVPPPQYTMIEGSEAVPVPVDEKSDKEPTA
ncbi:hypothetical protein C8T65DRAFT_658902 [Cerioporus squamosus]|nr:hypothetical protein C8T65DRAFT_658902 [Cerioporus squamosus]